MARNMFVKGPWRQVETLILCFYCQTKTVSTTIWHSIFKFHQVRCHLVVVWHNQFIAALSDGISSLTFQSNAKFSKGQFLAPESWDVKKKYFAQCGIDLQDGHCLDTMSVTCLVLFYHTSLDIDPFYQSLECKIVI